MNPFELSLAQLQEIAQTLTQRIHDGLGRDDQEIGCLPTYLGLPAPELQGRAMVVDTGGTNTRAALVRLTPHDGTLEAGPRSCRVPDGRHGEALSAQQFFAAQAEMAQGFATSEPLPLGYCFSYPAQATSQGDAVLLRWTKGLRIEGVIGQPVGSLLQSELGRAGVPISRVRVLNDTVASLLGGVHLYAEPRFEGRYIGLILGTGTNMASLFTPAQLTKVPRDVFAGQDAMVVNLESGNYAPPHLTEVDAAVDAASNNPGMQRFEKAVSGHYLPWLFHQLHPTAVDPDQGAGALVELRQTGSGPEADTAGRLLQRSAQLAAAALVGLAALHPPGDVAVLGEGGLLWGDPQYAQEVRRTLAELCPERCIELIQQRENVNLLGAACAALSP